MPTLRDTPFSVWLRVAALATVVAAGLAWSLIARHYGYSPLSVLEDGAVRLIEPADGADAAAPVTLVWASVPRAMRYHVEVLRPDGSVVLEQTVRDTLLVVPATTLEAGIDHRWWVRAVLPEGTRPSPTRGMHVSIR